MLYPMNLNDLTLNINKIYSLLAIKNGLPLLPLGGFKCIEDNMVFIESDGYYGVSNGKIGWIKYV